MRQREKMVDVYRKSETINAYNERVAHWEQVDSIPVILATATASRTETANVYRMEGTHTALCFKQGAVDVSDRLEDNGAVYDVLNVERGSRFDVISLKRQGVNEVCE